MSIQELRERLAALNKEANHILSEKGDRVWSKEDQKKFDDKMDEAERVKSQIEAHERLLKMDAEKNFRDAPKAEPNDKKNEGRRGLELFLRKNPSKMSAEEATLVRNTMSTTTGSEGGYTVQPIVAGTLIETLKDYGAMRRVAQREVTATGVDMSWPTTDGTSETGEIVAQNASASNSDPSFGTVPLNVQKFGSKVIAIPIELLQDSSIDIVAMVMRRMRDRIGRAQNGFYTTGTGTNQPKGLVTAAGIGKTGTTGQTLTVIYDDLVDMTDSIDPAYQEGTLKWMFGQTMRRTVRKIKDTAGRPIWTPSYDAGITQKTPDMLMGYPLEVNNDMPVPAANALSMAFGNLNEYIVRDSMEVTIFRFDDSVYAVKGQVGFLAWARSGGNLLDINGVKTYKHSAT